MIVSLNRPMYAVRANRKNNWYLGFVHTSNMYKDRIEQAAQNLLNCAFFFETQKDAEKFLEEYLKRTTIDPKNLRYYEPLCISKVNTTDNDEDFCIDNNVFVYGISCYFSMQEYCKWRRNPAKYDTKS